MKNTYLLSEKLKNFIRLHRNEDFIKLLLQQKKYPHIDIKFAVQQLEGYRKAQDKFPALAQYEDFLYPPKLNIEQCSSEQTAQYKSIEYATGKTVLDITGGLGIDAIYFAQNASQITYVEQNTELFAIAKQNMETLQLKNMKMYCNDGIAYLKHSETIFDLLYIDPARRDENNRKMVSFDSCTPNVLEHLDLFFEKAHSLLIKASPMMDITTALHQLKKVEKVTVVGIKNECKELLFFCNAKSVETSVSISCVHFVNENVVDIIETTYESEKTAYSNATCILGNYLYDPNVTIMKAGVFKILGTRYSLSKLHPNTHLYTGDEFVSDFPGRIFEVITTVSLTPKDIQKEIPDRKAHVITRNYPLTSEALQKKLRINEGGELFIIAATLNNEKKIGCICKRIR